MWEYRLFMFGAVYFLWRICRRLEATSVVLFLLFFGLAFVTKFSAVLLLPIFWLTVLGRMLSPEPLLIGAAGRVKLASRTSKMALFAGLFGAGLAGNLRHDLGVVFLPLFSRKKPGNGGEGRGANLAGRKPGIRAISGR